ncbi:hypothetical protein FHS70_004921 [Flammeovirga yaeyamensis]|nr:hypothetical protein [Flammeovirga yaeyamensis]
MILPPFWDDFECRDPLLASKLSSVVMTFLLKNGMINEMKLLQILHNI